MATLKVTTIGNSTGVILTKDILARLRVEKGDMLYAIETPNGIELTPYDPSFAKQMDLAEKIIHEDRDVLKRLAEWHGESEIHKNKKDKNKKDK